MAVMYSKLGGCLRDTTKLGPLARTEVCVWVKGLLDRLMTHFGLGSSEEDPWGRLWKSRGLSAFLGTSATCLGSSIVPLGSLGGPALSWVPTCLPELLPACLPAWFEGLLPGWKGPSPVGMSLGGTALPAWEVVLSLGRWGPVWLPTWEAIILLPSWEIALPASEVALSPGREPACLGSLRSH